MNKKDSTPGDRRAVLEKLGGACLAGTAGLATIWTKPVVNAVVLPAHAQTSGETGATPPVVILPTVSLTAVLNIADQVPVPTIPPGMNPSGRISALFDPNTNRLSLNGSATDLSSQSVMAHIHGPAAPDQNGPVIFPLELSGDPAIQLVTFDGILAAPNIEYLLNGMLYVNIHTLDNLSGEVRGQLIID